MDLWFPDVRVQKLAPRLIDSVGRFTSPFTGATRTIARTGDRWGFQVDLNDLNGLDRARVESLIANIRGAANRVIFSPSDYVQRGSFPAGEKLTNNNFTGGTTGWTVGGGTLSVTDRRLRLTFNGTGLAQVYQGCSLAANLPHVARYFLVDGKGTPLALAALQSFIEGSAISVSAISIEGLNVLVLVPDAASGNQFVFYPSSGALIPTGQIAGNYAEAVWTSITQCMLVDNGPNLLKFSDTLASPWTYGASSVAANVATAADGTTTAASITDTGANSAHYVAQSGLTISAAAGDVMACGEFKAAARSFAWLQIFEAIGNTFALQFFDLSGAGALATGSVGANWANLRAVIRSLGNGWFYCAAVARKTNAATSATLQTGPSNLGSTATYTGASSVAINTRRITLSQSSVPARQIASAGSAIPAIAQVGSAYFVKGLPVSTAGLLLPGDWVEINRELKKVTTQLDSDAAGLGYLQFSPPIRTSAGDNDPVIVNMPMGRFILSSDANGWQASPGIRATYSLDLVEAA